MTGRSLNLAWRVYLVWGLLALALAALILRLLYLQLDASERGKTFLQHQGELRVLRNEIVPAGRGEITDRNGKLLAYSTPVESLWVHPRIFGNNPQAVAALAAELGLEESAVKNVLASHPSFAYLGRRLEPEVVDRVMQLGLEGVYTETEFKRFYPATEIAAHLLGFTNIDDQGQEGIELAFNSVLQGKAGKRQVMRNAIGETIRHIRLIEAPEPGGAIQLSIDMNLQYLAYRELKAAVRRHAAKSGSMVILDVQSGEVLALVNQPSYNVNDRSQLVPERTRNRALIDVFEPGSTVKPFTIVAALENGTVGVNSLIETSPGYLRLNDKTILDPKDYGQLSVTEVLAKSSQVGTSKLALDMDIDKLRGMFARVGFGEYCATGFPGEQVGFLPYHKRWSDVQRATLAFGHGLTVNTLQLAKAYSVLAADGMKRPVTLLKQSQPSGTGKHVDVKPEQVVDERLAREVRRMMTVVVEDGTGKSAAIPGYSVAGKTGTAHKVGRGGYEENRYRATFAGMVPADNPRLVAVVTIDDPQDGQYFGGEIAAPVFAKVMNSALRLLAISPDRPEELDPSFPGRTGFAKLDEAV